ncbi:type II secretion system protein [bacterium]|nr:type II secretion system protein [bacterium]
MKNKAFTLAEVLITLGIIGIVAAMTIPTLMAEYRKKVIETRLAKFYSIINQAIQLAESNYGDRTNWDELGYGLIKDDEGNETNVAVAEAWVKKYILPYIKSDVKMINKDGNVQLYFYDGSMVAISGSGWLFYPNANKYKLAENGYISQKDAGKHFFLFFYAPTIQGTLGNEHIGNGVEPYKHGWDGTKEGLLHGWYGCAQEINTRAYCTELIKQNGWKIPDDYPIKI